MRILLIIFISALIIAFGMTRAIENRNDKLNLELYRFLFESQNPLREAIINNINKENLAEQLDSLISYELFKESCIGSIRAEIKKRIDIDGIGWIQIPDNLDYGITTDYAVEALDSILDSDEVDKLFANLFVDRVTNNIKEAEKIEEEAVEYHKTFGQEPEGDPVLHSKEHENEFYEDQEDKSLDDLIQVGTVEEITSTEA